MSPSVQNDLDKIKVVILAGGFGTRLSEETDKKPKALVTISDRPILWHIMKIYSYYGLHNFIICLGYKGEHIKEYFDRYFLHGADVTYNFEEAGKKTYHRHAVEPWKVTLVDTGLESMTGGRLKRIAPYIGDHPFMLTYGDGVSDINIHQLLDYHQSHGKLATVTTVQREGRFGMLDLTGQGRVAAFKEKPKDEASWINAGFFVLQPEVLDFIDDDQTVWEKEPMENLAKHGQLMAYRHHGFWHPMDMLRDKHALETLWETGKAPWKLW